MRANFVQNGHHPLHVVLFQLFLSIDTEQVFHGRSAGPFQSEYHWIRFLPAAYVAVGGLAQGGLVSPDTQVVIPDLKNLAQMVAKLSERFHGRFVFSGKKGPYLEGAANQSARFTGDHIKVFIGLDVGAGLEIQVQTLALDHFQIALCQYFRNPEDCGGGYRLPGYV